MQEIIDCSHKNRHCKGGQPSSVMDYIMKYGISTEENYPYIAKKNSCRAKYKYNKKKKKFKKRILEQLLWDFPKKLEDKRLLPRSRHDHREKFVTKYDPIKKKFYYEVTYLDGSVRYKDISRNPFIPSNLKWNNSQFKYLGSNIIKF